MNTNSLTEHTRQWTHLKHISATALIHTSCWFLREFFTNNIPLRTIDGRIRPAELKFSHPCPMVRAQNSCLKSMPETARGSSQPIVVYVSLFLGERRDSTFKLTTTISSHKFQVALFWKAPRSSKTLVSYHIITRRHIPEDLKSRNLPHAFRFIV
jgi:hypothetical protein